MKRKYIKKYIYSYRKGSSHSDVLPKIDVGKILENSYGGVHFLVKLQAVGPQIY